MKLGKVKIGLWGIGRHAERRLCPAFKYSKNAVLASVHTRDDGVGSQISKKYDCVYHDTIHKFLEDPNIDAVIISTPTGLHQAHGLQALSSSKHILVEKPFTHSGDKTNQVYALARQKKLIAMDGLMYLFHPQFQALKNEIKSGSLGSIRSISVRFGIPDIIDNTFRSQKNLGGGASLDMLCYPLSLAYQLTSVPPILLNSDIIETQASDLDIGGWCILQSENLIIDAHWGRGLAYRNELSVWGSKRSLHCSRIFTKEPDYHSEIQVRDSFGGKEPSLKTGCADAYTLMIDKFATDIRKGCQDLDAERASKWCAQMSSAIMC